MHEPENLTRCLDEIVQEIVSALERAEQEEFDAIGNELTLLGFRHKDHIEMDARATIRFISALTEFGATRGNRKKNLEPIRKVRSRIESLQEALREMPKHARYFLFSFEEKEQDCRTAFAEERQQKAVARVRDMVRLLNGLHARCDELIVNPPVHCKSLDHNEQLASEEAWDFMRRHFKRPVNDTPQSPFRVIASLFYEAKTGEVDVDLERACKATFDRKNLRQNNAIIG